MRLRSFTIAVVVTAMGAGLIAYRLAARSGGDSAALQAATALTPPAANGRAFATFAGGCFWCMEPPFEKLPGVLEVVSGYTGGQKRKPTYEEVSAGGTGHTEAVQIAYDPAKVTYAQLLRVYWHNVDPTTADRQFCDVGRQYRPAIFFHDEEQRRLALDSKAEVERTKRFPQPIVVEIVPAGEFYRAESYHQDYYKKNPVRYRFYRYNCGRDDRLQDLWGEAAGH